MSALDDVVTRLVPSLSRSLQAQFNVFRVMHHGTHEKQLSNVFAWLLDAEGTHELGARGQQIFLQLVNDAHPSETGLPSAGYAVTQEVDTRGHEHPGKDIADIVLTQQGACIVIENFGTSDGHGHDYGSYLTYGQARSRIGAADQPGRAVVVLLCGRHEPHLLTLGWQDATVVTYEALLTDLQREVRADQGWQRAHPAQHAFLDQLFQHFLKGPAALDLDDSIAFLAALCETGESARYGHRPQGAAAAAFAELLAQHARRQFDEGRSILAELKRTLKGLAGTGLKAKLNKQLTTGLVTEAHARFVGQWEWEVGLLREGAPDLYIIFGPSVVSENATLPQPLTDPDFTKIFAARRNASGKGIDRLIQTDVGLVEVLNGLPGDDTRLRDALLTLTSFE